MEQLNEEERRFLEASLHIQHDKAKRHGERHERNTHILIEMNRERRLCREILRKLGLREPEK
jgi:hypothetical protein